MKMPRPIMGLLKLFYLKFVIIKLKLSFMSILFKKSPLQQEQTILK